MKKLLQILLLGAIALCLSLNAQAAFHSFKTDLTGAAEAPPNLSPATGWSVVVYDDVMHTLAIHISFSGLVAPTTVAHIHAAGMLSPMGTAGVAVTPSTLPGFPAGVTSADYQHVVDLTDMASYTGAFLTANGGTTALAEAALIDFMSTDRAYVNVHTSAYPGGEIRGFLAPVPDIASTAGLFTVALALLGLAARRSRVTR